MAASDLIHCIGFVDGEHYFSDAGEMLSWRVVDSVGSTAGSISVTVAKTHGYGSNVLRNGLDSRLMFVWLFTRAGDRWHPSIMLRTAEVSSVEQTYDVASGNTIFKYTGKQLQQKFADSLKSVIEGFDYVLDDTAYGVELVKPFKGSKTQFKRWVKEILNTKQNLSEVVSFLDEIGIRVYWPAAVADIANAHVLLPEYHPEAEVVADDVPPLVGLTIKVADMKRPVADWEDTQIQCKVLTPDTDDDPEATFSVVSALGTISRDNTFVLSDTSITLPV